VEFETQTGIEHGAPVDVYQTWAWPAQPAPGQRQTARTLFSARSPSPSSPMKLVEDNGIDLVTPAPATMPGRGQVTVVCFRGSGQTGCGWGQVNTPAGMWSRFTMLTGARTDVGAGGLFNPALLAGAVAKGVWRVVGRTRLAGQQAIELSETGRVSAGVTVIEPLPALLWVNARTYLPIRLVNGTGRGDEAMTVVDFSFLPATPANVALTRVPVPPGYPRYVPKR
jgi:hypothetical protein